MFRGYSPLLQALMATLITWGATAVGAAVVFLVPLHLHERHLRPLLDASLGFAGGVMLAVSFWSLLVPAMEFAEQGGLYGKQSWAPVAIGILLGAAFVSVADRCIPGGTSDEVAILTEDRAADSVARDDVDKCGESPERKDSTTEMTAQESASTTNTERVDVEKQARPTVAANADVAPRDAAARQRALSWHRILLLVIAMVVHNVPEGLAVGVGFGALADVSSSAQAKEYATRFAQARTLAIAIAIQNLPEGLAVSLPLLRVGYSRTRAFMYGQLSGVVEPVGGVLGAALIVAMRPLLPYALSFAAGAMIFVVTHDVLPETRTPNGYPQLAQWSLMIGFVLMMILEVALE